MVAGPFVFTLREQSSGNFFKRPPRHLPHSLKEIVMQSHNPSPDSHPLPKKKRGRPPKSRIEIEENEDLEVDEGKEETGGYPDPSRFPEP